MPAYRFKCRNIKCGAEPLRHMSSEDFDKTQYSQYGHTCPQCGYPKMGVIKSNQSVKDGFVPGFQRNIMKHCSTYGEYKKELRKMGLVEIGYDELPPDPEYQTNYWTGDILRELHEAGYSDREIAAAESGEIFKN